ncbi:hypothetical protein QFZ76_009587 [Streptomyces sp. V4I2]|nr:hypothetical protein [Streptomyces sp. V4I2]
MSGAASARRVTFAVASLAALTTQAAAMFATQAKHQGGFLTPGPSRADPYRGSFEVRSGWAAPT